MTEHSETESQALRARAEILRQFWQDRMAAEQGTDHDAELRRNLIGAQYLAMVKALDEPDSPHLEPRVRLSEEWARFVSAPDAPADGPDDETAAAIENDDETANEVKELLYLRGAFSAWISSEGDAEIMFDRSSHIVTVTLIDEVVGAFHITADGIRDDAFQHGAEVVKRLLRSVRPPSGPGQQGAA